MLPSLPLFGHVTFSFSALLLACGVLAALATIERLAPRQRLRSDHLWTAAVLALISLFLGQRLVLFLRDWHSFLAHPLWMVGLVSIRDFRLFYAGAAIALVGTLAYLRLRRCRLLPAANVLLPGALLLLAFVHASYFAAGAEPGLRTSLRWGLVCTSRLAAQLYGTPLHIPLVPVALYASLGYALLALTATAAAARGRNGFPAHLLAAGLLTVVFGQLHMRWPGEPLLLGIFTRAQGAGIACCAVGAAFLLSRSRPKSRQ